MSESQQDRLILALWIKIGQILINGGGSWHSKVLFYIIYRSTKAYPPSSINFANINIKHTSNLLHYQQPVCFSLYVCDLKILENIRGCRNGREKTIACLGQQHCRVETQLWILPISQLPRHLQQWNQGISNVLFGIN